MLSTEQSVERGDSNQAKSGRESLLRHQAEEGSLTQESQTQAQGGPVPMVEGQSFRHPHHHGGRDLPCTGHKQGVGLRR